MRYINLHLHYITLHLNRFVRLTFRIWTEDFPDFNFVCSMLYV